MPAWSAWGRWTMTTRRGSGRSASARTRSGSPATRATTRSGRGRSPSTGAVRSWPRCSRPTGVAGSTWPPDERVVLEGWGLLQARIPGVRLIVAPHEPTGPHVASIERWAAARGIRVARVGAASDGATAEPAALLILDRVGPLGDLYAAADVAYVGGGFHADGLHSVLEPAAFGVPVVVGPRHGESRDARRLLAAGGAAAVRNAGELASTVGRWLADPVTRRDAGSRAQQIVVGGLGAASRSAAMVAELLERRA